MAKLTLTDLDSLSNETTAIANINANSTSIETAIENTLSRDGTGPNQMEANLDMNSYRIQNLPAPVGDTEPLRLADLSSLVAGQSDLDAAVADAEAQADAAAASAVAAAASASAAQTAETNAEAAEANAEAALAAIEALQDSADYRFVTHTGNGVTTSFSTSGTAAETNTFVFVNGVYQPQSTWSIVGSNLVFSVAPAGSATIEFMIGGNTTISTTSIGGVTGLQDALDLKANLASPTFTGTVTLPTLSVTNDISVTDDVTVGDDLTVSGSASVAETISLATGSASAPSYTFTGDTNTGIYRVGADQIALTTGGTSRMAISTTTIAPALPMYGNTSAGPGLEWNIGLGNTVATSRVRFVDDLIYLYSATSPRIITHGWGVNINSTQITSPSNVALWVDGSTGMIVSDSAITPSTSTNSTTATGAYIESGGRTTIATSSQTPLLINRQTTDGNLVAFFAQGNQEGVISVSGAVVTYGDFCGVHTSQLIDNTNPNIPLGTVVESINELADWEGETNNRLARFKVSTTPRSKAVYGVFHTWDEDGDAKIASLGVHPVRVQWDEVLEVGDLLESAGNGTARKQADDIVRSSTVAKVTSTTVIDTYKDGSFLVPCSLHCG